MAYSFHNQNMSTLSNVLVIHTALDKGETSNTTVFTIPGKVKARVMKTGYGKLVINNFYSLSPCSSGRWYYF